MAKKQQPVEAKKRTTSTRKNRVSIMLNDEEMRALNRLISTYKIKNKSKFIRETLMTTILKKFDEDHPTLF
jgi:metal-responsive CopG/Arc/MetJ family transcriptional regulator